MNSTTTPTRSSRKRFAKRAVAGAVFALVAIAPLGLVAANASAATTAGTNIGNAAHLTGSTTGSLPSSLADDWYVVYPATLGGTVTVSVVNTTTTTACTVVYVMVRNTNAGSIGTASLAPNKTYSTPFQATGSDRYFVELTDGGCNPPAGQPVKYSLKLVSGGGGSILPVKAANAKAGTTIGSPSPALRGGKSYTGTIASGVTDAWYVLYKHAGTTAATIRLENTTVKGSASCTVLAGVLRNTDGGAVGSVSLSANTATTFSVAAASRYYLELTDGHCTAGGVTYRIEPQPKNQWDKAAKLSSAKLPAGSTLAAAGHLNGGVFYTGTIASATTQAFVEFDTNGKAPVVTASVQNMTVNQATCSVLAVTLLDSHGNTVGAATLSDNTGHEFAVNTTGRFTLKVTDGNCTPTGSYLPTVDVTVTPANGVTTG